MPQVAAALPNDDPCSRADREREGRSNPGNTYRKHAEASGCRRPADCARSGATDRPGCLRRNDAARGLRHRRQQLHAGVDIPSDGEMSKVGYATYTRHRLSGFEGPGASPRAVPADFDAFPDYREHVTRSGWASYFRPVCRGPVEMQITGRCPRTSRTSDPRWATARGCIPQRCVARRDRCIPAERVLTRPGRPTSRLWPRP